MKNYVSNPSSDPLKGDMNFDFGLWADYYLRCQNLQSESIQDMTVENGLLRVPRAVPDGGSPRVLHSPRIRRLEDRVRKVRTTYSPGTFLEISSSFVLTLVVEVKDKRLQNLPHARSRSSSPPASRNDPISATTNIQGVSINTSELKRNTCLPTSPSPRKTNPGNTSEGKKLATSASLQSMSTRGTVNSDKRDAISESGGNKSEDRQEKKREGKERMEKEETNEEKEDKERKEATNKREST